MGIVILVPATVTADILCKGKLEDAQKVLKDAIDTIEKSQTAKDAFCQVSYIIIYKHIKYKGQFTMYIYQFLW